MARTNVFQVANYFIKKSLDEDEGSDLTPLKLQKLCYYAQGIYLAMHDGELLFDEKIQAWMHGPVSPDLYRCFSGSEPIIGLIKPNKYKCDLLPDDVKNLLDDVYEQFGQFSAWALRNMTHKEAPWKDNWRKDKTHIVIPTDDMKKYFQTLIG